MPRRIYGRIDSGYVECPKCGCLMALGFHSAQSVRRPEVYHPATGVLRCPGANCGRVYVLGILAWPLRGGGRGGPVGAARDKVPNPLQAKRLEKLIASRSWYHDEAIDRRRPSQSNSLAGQDEAEELVLLACTCPEPIVDPNCPAHGIDAQLKEE